MCRRRCAVILTMGNRCLRFAFVEARRILGSAKVEFTVPDDFNDPDPEIENLFYEGPLFPKTESPEMRTLLDTHAFLWGIGGTGECHNMLATSLWVRAIC